MPETSGSFFLLYTFLSKKQRITTKKSVSVKNTSKPNRLYRKAFTQKGKYNFKINHIDGLFTAQKPNFGTNQDILRQFVASTTPRNPCRIRTKRLTDFFDTSTKIYTTFTI